MADKTYIAIPTNIGLTKIQKAMFDNVPLELTQMAYGDGDGEYYIPTTDMTQLKNEIGRTAIQAKIIDPPNLVTWIYTIFSSSLPAGIIREVGVFDADGDLCFIANTPDIAKVDLEDGAMMDIPIELGIRNAYANFVEIVARPSGEYASQIWVSNNFATRTLSNLQLDYNGPVLWEDLEEQDISEAREVILRDLTTGEIIRPYGSGGAGNYLTVDYIDIELPITIE